VEDKRIYNIILYILIGVVVGEYIAMAIAFFLKLMGG